MYDDFLLNDKYDKDIQNTTNDLDNLFDSLTNDINSFNKYVDDSVFFDKNDSYNDYLRIYKESLMTAPMVKSSKTY